MRFLVSLLALVALLPSPMAEADGTTGTWTGEVDIRGNYYWEASTRVVAPGFGVKIETPTGERIGFDYLIDSITSASQASGLNSDIRFTERRQEGGFSIGKEFDLGSSQLDITVAPRASFEPDYKSYGGSIAATLSLNDRATVLRLSVNALHDRVGKIVRGLQRVGPDGRNLSDRGVVGKLNAVAIGFGYEQALSPQVTASLGYDLAIVDGFQENSYRLVVVDGVPLDETHPDRRRRHTVHGRLAYFFRPSRTAFHVMYRTYIDSWDVAAISPEARVYQELGDHVMLRGRYRFYTQRRAFFTSDNYTDADHFFTADPKLTTFHSHLAGLQLRIGLGFFERSALRFMHRSSLDFSFDYIWNTNRYGNGVIAQAGLKFPF